ncbi:MAG: oligoendopeptidase F [Bacilli bacterium]|nr:oligoendopeptidase F [Bacilli bacterium]
MAKLRKDYAEHLKWNVEDLFATPEDYEMMFEIINSSLSAYQKYQGKILSSAKTLLEFLEFDNELNRNLEQVYIYAHIQNDQDTTDTKFQAMYGKAYKLYEKYNEATAFIVPEILKQDFELIAKYIQEEPKLKEYERELKSIFKYKAHTLSDREELLLSSLSSAFSTPDDVFSMLSDADLKFGTILNEEGKKEELNEKSYRKFIESSNRNVRKKAFQQLLGTYGNFKNTYASLLSKEVILNNKVAQIKHYDSALASALYRNDIPETVYTSLISSVKNNIKPLSRFWRLKKQALGVSKLHLYDTVAPITKEITHKYSEKDAEDLLMKALAPLGETYITDLKQAFTERWIDFCPNDGKRNGAYCTACYNVHPYVLLSFDGSLNNVSTLAHELGHAMHYYYAIKNQNYQDYGYSIFVAEVASQVNQILLSKYLIESTTSKEEKKYLIDDLISDFKSTIYRQTMFAEFEKKIHESDANGEILTHEVICDIYYKLNQEYMGKNIEVDEIIKYEWERVPHFYMHFYVYQYATAYAAAIKIAMDILNGSKDAVTKYLEFLGLGCTKTPIESLKIAGVDMEKSETIDEAFVYFNDLVSELENLYKE